MKPRFLVRAPSDASWFKIHSFFICVFSRSFAAYTISPFIVRLNETFIDVLSHIAKNVFALKHGYFHLLYRMPL